jgi:YidC/Oxa1 family membrane protein insertase
VNIYDIAPVRALITATSWLVTSLNGLLSPVVGSASAALAIVLVTVAVRAVLIPVGLSQARAALVRRRLAPRLAELQRRYAGRPEVLQRKVAELYAAEHTSPLAGCLPVLAQTPVLMAVYGLFVVPTVAGQANALLSHAFLGLPLGTRLVGLLAAGTATWPAAAVFVVLVALIAAVTETSRRLLPPPSPAEGGGAVPAAVTSVVTRLTGFLPFTTALFAAFVPLAAGLYLATTTAWSLGERLVLAKVVASGAGGTPGHA